ncbi:hypothetical protein Y1Q_0002262 [Alligator mississippiensis]|uniref:Uncharacterized protein n=1 Tax=Alligator mississippiensis TaxID=8496 RepID=A0A151MGH9_ALLMI|nr:hypothetical protein Y1Q_0002262 [Alligator mississippiensis]
MRRTHHKEPLLLQGRAPNAVGRAVAFCSCCWSSREPKPRQAEQSSSKAYLKASPLRHFGHSERKQLGKSRAFNSRENCSPDLAFFTALDSVLTGVLK